MGASHSFHYGRSRLGKSEQFKFALQIVTFLSQGVVVCVTSLVMALAQDHLDAFAVCYTKAVDRLNKASSAVIYLWPL